MKKAYVILVVALCCLPMLLFPIAGEKTSAEKRELAAFPSLFEEGRFNASFSQELDAWITDHFSFRSELITANNLLKATLFSTSDEDQVIVGQEGWLYFAETADDYLGQNRMSEGEIESVASVLRLMEEYVAGRGGRFVFAVAPNKNTVYPEYMPSYYRRTQKETNLDRVTRRLAGEAYFADLKGALLACGEQTYHARDSHWNNLGALQGYNAIMKAAGRPHETYAGEDWEWRRIWEGDLDAMIFPKLGYKDLQAVFSTEWSYTYTSNFHSEEDILIATRNEEAEGSLLVFRDSFSNALLPFLAEQYETAKFSRAVPYTLHELETTAYTTVVVEIVERNLGNLLRQAPIMPAPQRDPEETGAAAEADAVIRSRETGGYLHYYGYAEKGAEEAGRIYLRLTNGTEERLVEAFPVFEASLLEKETEEMGKRENHAGFSAYLPLEGYGDYEVAAVLLEKRG